MRNLIFLVFLPLTIVTGLSAQWLEATIPVGSGPYDLCYNPLFNKVYCANLDDGSVTVIDAKYNLLIKTIRGVPDPFAFAYNSTNNKVYCANELRCAITIIDGRTDSVIRIVTVGDFPYCLFYNPINKKVYCGHAVLITMLR
jgi:YVTN family beta-propeller protein